MDNNQGQPNQEKEPVWPTVVVSIVIGLVIIAFLCLSRKP